jgi:hypothetical protein
MVLANEVDDYIRSRPICFACGSEKQVGCVVCWDCFKHRQDVTPFKYYDGNILEWLEYVAAAKSEASHAATNCFSTSDVVD